MGKVRKWDLVKFIVDCNKRDRVLKRHNPGSSASCARRPGPELNTSIAFQSTLASAFQSILVAEGRPNTAETRPPLQNGQAMRPSTAPQKFRTSSEGVEDNVVSTRPVTRDGKATQFSMKEQSLQLIGQNFKDNTEMLKIVQRLYPSVCTVQSPRKVQTQETPKNVNSTNDAFKTSTTPLWARIRSAKQVKLSSNKLPIKLR